MTVRTKNLLLNSLTTYENADTSTREGMIAHLKGELERNKSAENIGFPLDIDMVQGARIFLRIFGEHPRKITNHDQTTI